MTYSFTINPVAECSILVTFDADPSSHLSLFIGAITHSLAKSYSDWIMNITPSYNTILIDYLPHRIGLTEFLAKINYHISQENQPTHFSHNTVILPAYYDLSVGADLTEYLSDGLSLEKIIELHTEVEYTVSAIGFAPGFAFLSDVHPLLRKPRKASPRLNVPKGSIAIANKQTAVYPNASPGGWNIIGNCPISLYEPSKEPMTPFLIGQTVKFRPISKQEFISLGGVIPEKDIQ
ncbi:5-oxoprolinase subunit B family protein [Vibrio genomosp. F10]|uniref:5-oxoprolinase subunit B family protein n=1 Tax=Vibrio genomosp. F10 TaxID=723171 RepID=UPI0002F7DE2B|nr:carboxyltransferase domain-containing protein [Vibrio genomosp. F10]